MTTPRTDTERLDWWERQMSLAALARGLPQTTFKRPIDAVMTSSGSLNYRAAIDAAMCEEL